MTPDCYGITSIQQYQSCPHVYIQVNYSSVLVNELQITRLTFTTALLNVAMGMYVQHKPLLYIDEM